MRTPCRILALLLLVGCAHASPGPTTPRETPPAPSGPIASFGPRMPSPTPVVIRLRMDRLRETPYADEIATLVSRSGTWQVLARGSDASPVRDVDEMLCLAVPEDVGSAGIWARRWTFVLRHPHDDAEVRRRIAAMARANGHEARWSERGGYASVGLPVLPSGFAPHALVLTAPHEAVIVPDDALDWATLAADDHAARRAHGLAADDPALAAAPDELAFVSIVTSPEHDARLRYPDGGSSGRVRRFVSTLRRTEGGARLELELAFGDAADAAEAEQALRALVRRETDRTMARLVGLDRIAAALESRSEGAILRFGLSLDDAQVRVVLSLLAVLVE